ncbi:UDP-N-acetylmuramate dehydrogenase [Pseudoclavibacter chungangensis]|uniref:UDP-N-acetylenolpyruvoylglucosamine reductase n=1 Tax=Pseudoclavibacter chungangensis TaxID=587635 RepID=A0A7J5BR16_9MICO|nr:UDP-N-acetylmuramate dehydrogenase [Pseudoclavibacter chungangensis]KAB1656700.1 UDP-N-acetylmuramate dehydrogenase [Pseudoclavibacter chungangensis]NYJ67846.1 UDP-N-acetylmuramate dehydrogenase [Pseudoclavibacter chungangensis]
MTVRLADLTTMRVGGPAERLFEPPTRDELVGTARELFAEVDPFDPSTAVVLLAGGSNTIVGDEPVTNSVLHVVTRGVELLDDVAEGRVGLRVDAGERWGALVDLAVARGFAGIEALAGIPGSVGAAPVQNIGAYGQEVSSVLRRVEFYDADLDEVVWIDAADLGLGYRSSVLKRGERTGVVLRVEIELQAPGDGLGAPIAYAQLAGALGAELGERRPIAEVRDAVVALRASKGMVLDPTDADSCSAGSFFMNPVVSQSFASGLPADAPRFRQAAAPDGTPLVKLSAAWLIEHAGVRKGFSLPGSRAAISSKHTLAITNRGGATAVEVTELARFVQARVLAEYGVVLQPEPVFVDAEL